MTAMRPTGRHVYCVRWRRQGARGDVGVRYFARQADAEKYATKLDRWGKDARIYVTAATWAEVPR